MSLARYGTHDHTFVVCAYKESPYLAECISSLLSQTKRTNIIVVTSTPNEYIESVCNRLNVPLLVGSHESGIARDWSFGLSKAETPLVTIAHQDDVYKPQYAERMLDSVNSTENPLIYFCNYSELRDGEEVGDNGLLHVKRAMLLPLRVNALKNSRFIRRRILSLGSPICCPSVTFVRPNLSEPIFTDELRCDLDWQAWERVSKLSGAFLYDSEICMSHRVHEGSETTALIRDDTRSKEDFIMFSCFWPKWVARVLVKLYSTSQRSNTL